MTNVDPLPSTPHLFRHAPWSIILGWCIALILTTISVVATRMHIKRLRQHTATRRRDLYIDIVNVGVVFCVSGGLSLVSPRTAVLFDLLQRVYEARVLYDFGHLLMNYIAGENVYNPRETRRLCVEALEALPPSKFLKVPPFGLCCLCAAPRKFDEALIRFVRRNLKQYLYVAPACAVYVLWLELATEAFERSSGPFVLVARAVNSLSTLFAVYGLFILYGATRKMLSHFSTTYKFFAIKGLLFVSALQDLIVAIFIKPKYESSTHGQFADLFFVVYWVSFAKCVEGFVMSILLIHSFSPTEVEADYEDTALKRMGSKLKPADDSYAALDAA